MSKVFSSKQKFKSVSGSIHQKSSNKLPSTSCFSANNLKVKALHKTPIYVHDPGQTSLLRNRVQSDFVYVPPYPNRDRQENATESDTTCDQSVKKVSIKGFLQRHTTTNQKKVPPVSENLRNKSPTGCQNTVENRLVVANEKVSKKDEVSLLQSETSRSEIRHKDEQPIQDFELYEEMLKTHPRQVLSQFVLTEEERRRIQSTLPPGEPIVIPKIYATIFDKFGRSFRVLAKNSRKCLCKPDVSKHVNPLPSTEVPDKSKRATFLVDGKKNQKPGLKSKESWSIGGTKRKLSSERKSSIPFNTKLTLLEGAPKDFKIPKEADFGFKFGRRIRTKKKPIRRPPEKKVDEDDVYKSLVSVSTGRLNRSQYQLHYHLRIKGPSVMKDLKFDPVKVYILGERGSGLRARGDVQDFYKLRDELLESGNLFEDPDFPPTDSSLYYSQRADRRFEWKRPHEICENPQLFVEGYSRFDVQQGELGDCWLLAAVANLTLYRRLFFQVVPDDQSFDDKYAGIFHFRFWQYGRWIDVVIDDLLPTYNGQLVFLHSTEDNEFWSALLEKAYAKLHGSYEALKGGSTCEAMEDFTGGVTEMYEMNASPPNLFKIVLKAYERSSLMGCSLEPDPNVLEAETREGLIRGHAYSITRVKYVDIQTPNTSGKIPLLRLRNPWGNEAEWNGPWSDKSPEWRFIPESEKEELGLTFDDDGEFWMSFKDFQRYFDRLEICNLNPDSLTEDEIQEGNKKKWEVSFYEGEWVRGVTAGGCRNYLETFWHNPQYRVTLTEVDEGDEDGKCTLIVALMQKNRRSQRNMGIDVLTIGFAIYYLPNPDILPKPLNLNFFKYNASVARSPSFINLREVSCRFKLPPGTYCIVPSTFEPNEEGEFLLRVFSEHQNNMEENDEEIGYGEIDQRMRKEIFAPLHAVPILPVYASDDKTVRTVQPSPQEQQEKDQVYQFFLKLAGDDGEVDWMELKEILDYAMRMEMRNRGFSNDVCRSMVAMLDTDRSGKLGFEEFKSLWSDIRDWKNVFRLYDKDNSGTLDGFELRQALNSAGYHLNNHILNILMHRYGSKQGQLEFDNFIMCAVKLKAMINIFKLKDPDNTNTASFALEEWIVNTLYA